VSDLEQAMRGDRIDLPLRLAGRERRDRSQRWIEKP
jgi:hypothetical protein